MEMPRSEVVLVLVIAILVLIFDVLGRILTPRRGPSYSYTTRDGRVIPVRSAPQASRRAVAWRCVGCLLLLTSWVPALSDRAFSECVKLMFIWGGSGAFCFVVGRQLTTRPSQDALGSGRPLVLYLRSFQDDQEEAPSYRPEDWLAGLSGSASSPEQILVSTFEGCGPPVAVGRPEDRLPPLGASRLYVEDEHWQEVVRDLISRSAVVLLRLGTSPGLRWELAEAVRLLGPEKLVLYLPLSGGWFRSGRQKLYEELRGWADACLPVPLPETVGAASVIFFDKDWRPRLLEPGCPVNYAPIAGEGSHPLGWWLTDIARSAKFLPQAPLFDFEGLGAWATLVVALALLAILACLSMCGML